MKDIELFNNHFQNYKVRDSQSTINHCRCALQSWKQRLCLQSFLVC